MTVFGAILGLTILGGFVYGVIKLNAYSEVTYGYTPVNIINILLGFIPWAIIVAGIYGENHGEVGSLALGIFFAVIAAIFIFRGVAKKTSVGIAIVTVFFVMTINIAILLLAMGEEARRTNNYYDDD